MNQRKDLNLNIKKSTVKTIRKYLLVIFCCFIVAMIYPFINIYWGTYSVYIVDNPNTDRPYNGELAMIRLNPYIEDKSRELYSQYYRGENEYPEITWLAGIQRDQISHYMIQEETQRAEENISKYINIFSSIKMVFGIEHYAKIFYWTFFSLLVIIIVIMNFKFNFKIKDE